MASLTTDKKTGLRRIQFSLDGKRRTLRLGRASKKDAQYILGKIEHLLHSRIAGSPPPEEVSRWLQGLTGSMHKRLSSCGLVGERTDRRLSWKEWLEDYIAANPQAKPNTIKTWRQAVRRLEDFLGEGATLGGLTPTRAKEWATWLHQEHATATASTHIKKLKQFCTVAGLTPNPFEGIKPGPQDNDQRGNFVDRKTISQVLEQAPDTQWRAIIILARYAGLRTPSETLSLRWSDVLWDQNALIITAPKLEGTRKHKRRMPMLPEVQQVLLELVELAEKGEEFIVNRTRNPAANWRTTFQKIIERAKVEPWERLFHNLRGSLQTELAQQGIPLQTVCRWLGNSPPTALKHYLHDREEDFRRVTQGTEATQKATQHTLD